MAAELADQSRVPRRDSVQRIPNMEPFYGARRALQLRHIAIADFGKGDNGSVHTILDPGGENADHALMPALIEQTQGCGHLVIAQRHLIEKAEGLLTHIGLDLFTILIHGIEFSSQSLCLCGSTGQQAFDPGRHVIQPTRRIQTRPKTETQITRRYGCSLPIGNAQERHNTWPTLAGTNSVETGIHQNTVVMIQRDDIGNGSQGYQVQQFCQVGFRDTLTLKPACLTQFSAQGEHDVEDDADTGDALTRKFAARLIGINYGLGSGEFLGSQMMIGHQHADAEILGPGHTLDTGDAIVDGNYQVWTALLCQLDYFRGQAIAVFKSVGDDVVDRHGSELPQSRECQRATGRPVGIEIRYYQYSLLLVERVDKQPNGILHALQLSRSQQVPEIQFQVFGTIDVTLAIDAPQQRVQGIREVQISYDRATLNLCRHEPQARALALIKSVTADNSFATTV